MATSLCTNYRGCDAYCASYKRGQDTCTGCGGDVAATRAVTRLLDRHVDRLAAHAAEHEERGFPELLVTCVEQFIAEMDELGHKVKPWDANMGLQLRALQTIHALREGIKNAH